MMQRIPSNRMPPLPEQRCTWQCRLLLLFLCLLFLLLFWIQPYYLIFPIVIAIVVAIQSQFEARQSKKIAAIREGESLCSFAKAIDYRRIDTWVIRAVYEQIQPLVQFPIRVTDHLFDDLRIDPEDLDDVAEEIAIRTGRPLKAMEENPKYGQTKTVMDLIDFFDCQPKKAH